MKFDKYKRHGAYHWRLYEKNRKYRAHIAFLQEFVKEKRILDVGAGDGLITYMLGARGIEPEPEGVRLAQEKGANVMLGNAYNLPFENNSFDAVTMFDVLEHLERPLDALKEARRVAPRLYIHTPPKDDKPLHRYHVQEWSPTGLRELVEQAGYILDGSIIVNPKERLMYATFI